jgi:hypothetical protein
MAMRLEGKLILLRELFLLIDYFAETEDSLVVVLVSAHEIVGIVEGEEEGAEEADELGEVLIEVVFRRSIW